MSDFKKELTELINKHSKENGSDTPDYILAEFLKDVLIALDKAIYTREAWYGRSIKRRNRHHEIEELNIKG